MEEIKVGEYVRTKGGYIAKVLSVAKPRSIISSFSGRKVTYQPRYWIDNKSGSITKSYITKHSKNIIDLIEVGDYVNGKRVVMVKDYEDFKKICFDEDFDDVAYKEDIKSIVTKEQFESMEYKVGD